jgi:hypothetical protein
MNYGNHNDRLMTYYMSPKISFLKLFRSCNTKQYNNQASKNLFSKFILILSFLVTLLLVVTVFFITFFLNK